MYRQWRKSGLKQCLTAMLVLSGGVIAAGEVTVYKAVTLPEEFLSKLGPDLRAKIVAETQAMSGQMLEMQAQTVLTKPILDASRQNEVIKAQDELLRLQFPVSAQTIRTLNVKEQDHAALVNKPLNSLKTSQRIIPVDPTQQAPIRIHLIPQMPLGVYFQDTNAKTWPIEYFHTGSSSQKGGGGGGDVTPLAIEWNDKRPHVLSVTSRSMGHERGVNVLLQGKSTPLVIHFITTVDNPLSVAVVRMPGNGPNAEPALVVDPFEEGNPASEILRSFANSGGVPDSALALDVVGIAHTEAWFVGDRTLVRSPYVMTAPVRATVDDAHGTHLYSINHRASAAFFLDNAGRKVNVAFRERASRL